MDYEETRLKGLASQFTNATTNKFIRKIFVTYWVSLLSCFGMIFLDISLLNLVRTESIEKYFYNFYAFLT